MTSTSVLVDGSRKCMLAASRVAPWWVFWYRQQGSWP